jgi:hypothetical protein
LYRYQAPPHVEEGIPLLRKGTRKALAASGIQIFIATPDYLLSHELSLLAEYPSENSIAKLRYSTFAVL